MVSDRSLPPRLRVRGAERIGAHAGLVPDMASGPFKRQTRKEAVATYLSKVASSTHMVDALLGRREEHPTEVLTGDEWMDYFLEQAETASTLSASHVQFMQDKLSGLDLAC